MINEENINGWEKTTLGNIADYINGRAFKPTEWQSSGIPIIRIQNLNNENASYNYYQGDLDDKYKVKSGDLLYSWSASLDSYIWSGKDAYLNQHIFNVKPYGGIYKKFIYYLLKQISSDILGKTHGMGMVHITKGKFENIEIFLPPLNEQNRIVDKIETLFSEVDAGIENLTLAKRQLEQYRQSLLKHAFEGKLTAKWREEYAEKHGKPLPGADELLKQIQAARQNYYDQQIADWEQAVKDWEEQGKECRKPSKPSKPYLDKLAKHSENQLLIPLGSIIEQPKYGTSKKCTYDQSQNSIGVIRIPNINSNGLIELTDMKFAEFDNDEIYEYKLEKDDLLIIRSNGSPSIVGRCAVVNEKDLTYIYAGYLIRLRPIKSLIDSDFLNLALKSVKLRSEIENKAKSTSGVNNINAKEIQSLELPYFNMLEQIRIVETVLPKIQLIENQLNDIDIALRKADILKQSILYRAFQGKLVPRDPNDPPASELLAQIKAEREAKILAEKQAKKAKSKGKVKTKSAKTPKKSKKDEQITLPL